MDLIRISKAQLAYGTHPLLDDADAVIETGERVCIVGRNGAGKSTLLKVLDGQVILDDGEINQLGGIKISRLEQDPPKGASGTVFDYVAQGMPDTLKEFVEYLHEGSLQARVDSVAIEWQSVSKTFDEFSVLQ